MPLGVSESRDCSQLGVCRLLTRLLFNERAPPKEGMSCPASTLVRRLSPNLLRALGALFGPFREQDRQLDAPELVMYLVNTLKDEADETGVRKSFG